MAQVISLVGWPKIVRGFKQHWRGLEWYVSHWVPLGERGRGGSGQVASRRGSVSHTLDPKHHQNQRKVASFKVKQLVMIALLLDKQCLPWAVQCPKKCLRWFPNTSAKTLFSPDMQNKQSQCYLLLSTKDLSPLICAMLHPRRPLRACFGVHPEVHRDPPIGQSRPVAIAIHLLDR